MAQQKDFLARLADAGEEAIQRLGDVPGADKITGALNTMRDRMDEMQKKLRGLDAMEKRLAVLEKRVDALAGGSSGTRRAASSRPSSARARSPRAATSTGGQDPGAATSGRGRKSSSSGTSGSGTKKSTRKRST